jgi:two-component system sensor histidine kinase QseC
VNSIRVFLVVVILATITLFSFIAAIRGYQSSMQEAERLFDMQLLDTAKLIANIHAEHTARNLDHTAHIAFQVWRNDQLLAASNNAPAEAISSFEHGFGYSNFDGYRWRTASYLDPVNGNWILAADRTDLRYSLAENVILESLFPTLVGLPIVGLLIWLIVSGGLRPLKALAGELGGKHPDDLSPLAIDEPKKELAKIVESCNDLLRRLETSLLREKQFASDAAHELRTPISALKLQVFNLQPLLQSEPQRFQELQATTQRLEHIVEQILDLYRSSPDRFNASFENIELAALARKTVAEMFPAFERKGQDVAFSGDPCLLLGDRFALDTLLRNLLDNANKYAPPGSKVRVTVKALEHGVRLSVEDSGPGIPEQQRQAVFERFYRSGGDRHPSGEPGCGLGLAIVKHLVELHAARLSLGPSRFESGLAVRIDFPGPGAGGDEHA